MVLVLLGRESRHTRRPGGAGRIAHGRRTLQRSGSLDLTGLLPERPRRTRPHRGDREPEATHGTPQPYPRQDQPSYQDPGPRHYRDSRSQCVNCRDIIGRDIIGTRLPQYTQKDIPMHKITQIYTKPHTHTPKKKL